MDIELAVKAASILRSLVMTSRRPWSYESEHFAIAGGKSLAIAHQVSGMYARKVCGLYYKNYIVIIMTSYIAM